MYKYRKNGIGFLISALHAQTDMEHTASICHLFNNGVSVTCAGVVIICVWAAYIRVWAAIIRVCAAYTPRMLGAVGVCTAHLSRTYCVMYAQWSHSDFFLACSKFDGVCLAHLGDSNAHVWRTHSVNEDSWAYVTYPPRICYFFRTPC